MIRAVEIFLCVMAAFTAIGIACAVRLAIGWRPQSDPFSEPFGEMPGFSAEQLARLAPRVCTSDPLRRSFAPGRVLGPDEQLGRDGVVRRHSPILPIPPEFALHPRAADGGLPFPSGFAAVRALFWKGPRHA